MMGDLAPFFEARAERNAYLASAALISYEYFLQLGAEVEFFWKQRWSIGKVLFLWSRYYGLLFNVSNASVYLHPKPSYSVRSRFFHWQNTGASLQVITSHLILQLRLSAMYGNSWKIVTLCVLLTIGEALTMGIVFGIPNDKLISTHEPAPGVYICADGDPRDGSRWLVYYWMSILVIDTILLSLALFQAWRFRPLTGDGSALMMALTKDSVTYYLIIFWVYLANLTVWIINHITLNELLTSFSFVISSILANRLLISVRKEHLCSDSQEIPTSGDGKSGRHVRDEGTVELSTFFDSTVSAGTTAQRSSQPEQQPTA
ncbi:hypothetical protein L218DRAFT_989505 [Marasmius fiardii PR-910]|nr:hypothetical protein L218DRAFT_989505 [Marasmius fiardii PR-910]